MAAVSATTFIYHIYPFRKPGESKPKFALFPKYISCFSIPIEEVTSRIEESGFVARKENPDDYDRGKIYGDFSAKLMKLRIRLDKEDSTVKVFAPYFWILFDNGDLWKNCQ